MRIVAGEARGRRLEAPKGDKTRPTGDRVREALFNVLQGEVVDARVLDLYAGTGALSFEALSRGACHATLIEPSRVACATIKENVAHLDMGYRVTLLAMTAEHYLRITRDVAFDLIFCDPPWRLGVSEPIRQVLEKFLAASGRLVLEHASRQPVPTIPGLRCDKTRHYGDTALSFFGHQGGQA